ncbi:MAG TPA: replicative DNA helicase [Terriglobales bacterium]|nr:replicative DNA helicase [Terriglobales bacterium]
MATTDYSIERGLPSSMDAERSILGSILLDNAAYYQASETLRAEEFSLDSHRRIFARVSEMMESSRPVDIITLSEELRQQQQLEAVGGVAYLASLTDGVPPRANIQHYVRIVKDKALLRGLINLSNQSISRAIEQSEPVEAILNDVEQGLIGLSEDARDTGFFSISDIVTEHNIVQRITNQTAGITGLRTHYDDLDEMTSGLQKGDLIIVAARPSMGKTSFVMNIAENAGVRDKAVVAVFSLEMSRESLLMRMLCSYARVDSHHLRTGFLNRDEISKLSNAVGELMEAPIFIDDTPGISVMEMRAKCRRLKQEHGGRLDLIVVDYLQLMSSGPAGGGRKYANRTEEVSAMSRGLKLLAKEMHAPLVALSQLSRAPESRTGAHQPQLSDLRESGSIEQDADVVGFIYRPEVYERDESKKEELKGQAELIVAKQRNGPVGTVKLAFLHKYTRFESVSHLDGTDYGVQ